MTDRGETAPSASERIHASLKASLLDFRLKPGQKLTEAQLSADFNVSRTPVREALQRLVREGLVLALPREGYFVKAFDLDEIDRYYEVRIALEALGVELAAGVMRPEVLADLEAVWSKPLAAIDQVDADLMVRMDETFHQTIAAESGNPVLLRFLREVNERIRIIRRLDFTQPGPVWKTYEDHAPILAHIKAGDAAGAAARMRRHIEESRERTRALATERLARIYLQSA
jgi:DNA-binding GntR family transcriptional regulator